MWFDWCSIHQKHSVFECLAMQLHRLVWMQENSFRREFSTQKFVIFNKLLASRMLSSLHSWECSRTAVLDMFKVSPHTKDFNSWELNGLKNRNFLRLQFVRIECIREFQFSKCVVFRRHFDIIFIYQSKLSLIWKQGWCYYC